MSDSTKAGDLPTVAAAVTTDDASRKRPFECTNSSDSNHPMVDENQNPLDDPNFDSSSASIVRLPYQKSKRPRKYTKPRTWSESFALLVAFKEEHNHCNVPFYYNQDRNLGDWVSKQRKNRAELSSEQRDLLDGIGFDFVSTQERIWNEKFARLQAFFRQNGHSNVPSNYKDDHDTDLTNWVAKQRQIYAQKRMTKDRVERLNSVQFVWRIKQHSNRNRDHSKEDQKWMEKYERLAAFKKEFGTTAVPFQWDNDKSLGRWVNEQRTQNTRGLLRPDRKELLMKLDFLWSINKKNGNEAKKVPKIKKPKQPRRQSDKKLHQSQHSPNTATGRYHSEQHLLRQQKQQQHQPHISSSMSQQPTAHSTCRPLQQRTTPKAIGKLPSVVFASPAVSDNNDKENAAPTPVPDTSFKQETFETMFHRLINYRRQNGHVNVPRDYNNQSLGPWLFHIQQEARDGKLDEVQATKLRSVGVILQGDDQIWLDHFRKLRSYKEKHGHSQVSSWEDSELAIWVSSQKKLHQQGKLRPDRKLRLESIRFSWDTKGTSSQYLLVSPQQDMPVKASKRIEDNEAGDLGKVEGGILAAACSWNG